MGDPKDTKVDMSKLEKFTEVKITPPDCYILDPDRINTFEDIKNILIGIGFVLAVTMLSPRQFCLNM